MSISRSFQSIHMPSTALPMARRLCALPGLIHGAKSSVKSSLAMSRASIKSMPLDANCSNSRVALSSVTVRERRPRLADIGALRFLPLRNAWGNYAATVERLLRNPLLRQIYNRYPTYVGSSPYLSPATLLIIPFLEREFGAWYINGGLYKLIESLSRLLAERGVELWTGTKVEAIAQRESRVSGVNLADGRFMEADLVVMNGDVATAGVLLRNASPQQTSPQHTSPQLRSMSGFVLLAGVAARPLGLCHHTVLFSPDYRSEFDELFAGRFPTDPTLYISAPAVSDASVAPPGGDALFVMANAPANGETWGEEDVRNATCVVLRNLARHGLRLDPGSIFETWHPGRIANQYLAPGGAIYGTHSHGWKQAFFRPANRSSRVKGLYFVGGSTHPGGGTPTVLMSAEIVSRMIEADMLASGAHAGA